MQATVGELSILGWGGHTIHATLAKTVKLDHTALKSLNKPSLTAFIISKNHVATQKPCGKQLVNFLYWDGWTCDTYVCETIKVDHK